MYIWGETDNIHRFDVAEDPREVESRIISSKSEEVLAIDDIRFIDHIFHSEVEARVSDADKGHLFLTFIRSTGAKGNDVPHIDFVRTTCHCYCIYFRCFPLQVLSSRTYIIRNDVVTEM